MVNKSIAGITTLCLLLAFTLSSAEEDGSQGPPPAPVVVSEVTSGMISPETEFVGTVFYEEVSDVASEVNGKVEAVEFEAGQRIEKGSLLVKVSSDLLEKSLQASQARHEQVLADLEQAEKDLSRAETLFADRLISEQSYDERRFRAKSLKKQSLSLHAEVERYRIELLKKEIRSPFDGVVLERSVDRGEWLEPGSSVGAIAKDSVVDIIVEVPEAIAGHTKRGMEVRLTAGGKEMSGKVFALIPKGNISTRTFPVKIRTKNPHGLAEGMEARVTLPTGEKQKTLTVPRDAVITVFGTPGVYAVRESEARMVPVVIIGYDGLTAGIKAEGLAEGMKVVIKGNERLMDGQSVEIKENL